jgi:hypothetical protein
MYDNYYLLQCLGVVIIVVMPSAPALCIRYCEFITPAKAYLDTEG